MKFEGIRKRRAPALSERRRAARTQGECTEAERLRYARKLIRKAMEEIILSKEAIHMARELNDLRHIEDVLWQVSGEMSRSAKGGAR